MNSNNTATTTMRPMTTRTRLAAELLAGNPAQDPFRYTHEDIASLLRDERFSLDEILDACDAVPETHFWIRSQMTGVE